MTKANDKLNHLRYIDALRGIAFLSVMTVHVGGAAGFTAHRLTIAGQYGVQLFYLLSAITLLRSLHMRSRVESRPTINFYIRRIFRIGPLFWLGMVAYSFLNPTGSQFFAPNGIHPWQYLLTFFFVHGWAPASINSVVPGGWSIAAEMNCYLVLPLIWRRVQSITRAGIGSLLAVPLSLLLGRVVVHLLGKHYPADQYYLLQIFVMYWFPAQISIFLLGFVLYYLVHNHAAMQSLRGGSSPYLLVAAGAYLLVAFSQIADSPLMPPAMLFSVAWSFFVVGLAARPFALLVNPFSRYLGKVSFSGYLTHFAMIDLAGSLLHRLNGDRLPHPASFACLWILVLVLTLTLSTLTYRLIEKPGIWVGNRLIAKLEASALPPAA